MSGDGPDRLGQAVLKASVVTASGDRGRAQRRVGRELRRALVLFRDPVIEYELLGKRLRFRLSHDLPIARAEHPSYSDNLRRVAAAVHDAHPGTLAVDVGANVGDSVVFLQRAGYERIIAVEPAPEFIAFLRENVRDDAGVVIEEVLLARAIGTLDGEIVTTKGTGRWVSDGGLLGHTTPATTVDALVAAHADLGTVSLIKTDTDGYDLEILRGAEQTMAARPVLFFEYDPRRFDISVATWREFTAWLNDNDYGPMVFFDHVGDFVAAGDAGDTRILDELDHYARITSAPHFYFDIAAFARSDADIADSIRAAELTL